MKARNPFCLLSLACLLAPPALRAQDTSITLNPVSVKGVAASPLQQAPTLGKTGTKLEDIPSSIQIVPIETAQEQGVTSLSGTVRDVSSVNVGGPSSYGFFDRFLIRGLDARIYSDGFSDGDMLNGWPHSLVGVQQIEVLKGPGSALLGNGTPGGSINLVHFAPSPAPAYGVGAQVGSFNTYSANAYATGPTGAKDLNYRLDASAAHADGYRDLKSADYEIRPVLGWTEGSHAVTLALDAQYIKRTPDTYGVIYVNGTPLDATHGDKYSTPFARGNQDVEHASLSDAWRISDALTINNRFSYLHRDVDLLRNSGGSVADSAFTKRQLREQTDHDNDFNYQFEPVWKFGTGPVAHTLLTGAQAEQQYIDANRATADLPSIADIYAPVIPETSTSGLVFRRDATHAGLINDLSATLLSAYATDQIDVTQQFKVRLSVRQDWWFERLTPQDSAIAGDFQPNTNQLYQPGVTYKRTDKPLSWSAGALYKLPYGISPFLGASKSYLTNFNSEATEKGIYAPESGLEYEAGVKIAEFRDRMILTGSVFKISRDNVFTEATQSDGVDSVFFDDQETRGIEADLQAEPLPHWKVLANGTLQHAILTNQPNNTALNGQRPAGVPERILNLWTTYDFTTMGLNGLRIGGGATYNSKSYAKTPNASYAPAYTVCDAMAGYYRPRWDAELGVRNIADVTYYTTALSAGGAPGAPRNGYLKANYHW